MSNDFYLENSNMMTTEIAAHNFESAQQKWDKVVTLAINNLFKVSSRQEETCEKILFQTDQLFMNDDRRFTVKAKAMHAFKIFPWFLLFKSNSKHRYRETLVPKNGECIDAVTVAVNYFWTEIFEEADYVNLRAYYQNGPPPRTIWFIVELQSHIEKSRLIRQTQMLKSSNLVLSTRMLALEEQMRVLMLVLSEQEKVAQKIIPSSFPRSCKRKGDINEDDASIRKTEFMERIWNSSDQGNESQSGSDEVSFESESEASYLEMPLELLDLSYDEFSSDFTLFDPM
jgi:hypothetical protein